jgi:hypothetical protein
MCVSGRIRGHCGRRECPIPITAKAMLTDSSMDNIEAQILANLYNPKQPGFLSACITGRQYSHLKPRGAMRSLPSPEEAAVINLDPQGEQDAGEFANHTASPHEDKRVIGATKYRIETVIGVADFRFSQEPRNPKRVLINADYDVLSRK